MAVAFDANLGSTDVNGAVNGVTINLTTTAASAANSRIIVQVSLYDGGATNARVSSVTAGGTTLTRDGSPVVNGDDVFEMWSADRAAVLTLGSTIAVVITSATNVGGVFVGACSATFGGPSQLVTTASSTSTGATWSSGAASNTGFPDAIYIGGSGSENPTNNTTSTATVGTEVHDRHRNTDQQGFVTGQLVVSTVASRAITGTFSNANSTANTGGLAIYAPVATATPRNLATLGVGA